MPSVFLFCIAEEAKTLVRKALRDVTVAPGRGLFSLVESRNDLSDGHLKRVLADDESFETDFIGASEQDCREWALENQFLAKMVDHDIIAIADQRSASDDTLSVQHYTWEALPDPETLEIPPRENNKWFTFRVLYKDASRVHVALSHTAKGIVRPVYFERKDEFTDERGVFNVDQAEELWKTGSGC